MNPIEFYKRFGSLSEVLPWGEALCSQLHGGRPSPPGAGAARQGLRPLPELRSVVGEAPEFQGRKRRNLTRFHQILHYFTLFHPCLALIVQWKCHREAFSQLLERLEIKCEDLRGFSLKAIGQEPRDAFDFLDVRSCGTVSLREAPERLPSATLRGRGRVAERHAGDEGRKGTSPCSGHEVQLILLETISLI